MKKLFFLLFIMFSVSGFAQPFNNSWIDYSKTYYKFSVGKTGLYRIPQAALASAGLGSVSGQHFQLWRNGEQVRLFTTEAGPLSSNGYIEFWGLANDGKVDRRLYREAEFQLSDAHSLQTDTASYFLTVNTSSPNLRFTNAPNNVSGTTLTPEAYFMNRVKVNYKYQMNAGYAAVVGFYVYSSSYDIGEGWTSSDIVPNFHLFHVVPNLNLHTTGPNASFKIGVSGNALNPRNVRVRLWNTNIINEPLDYFQSKHMENNNIPISALAVNPNSLQVVMENGATGYPTDRMVVSYFEVRYPSKWNFNGQNSFDFEMPASATGNHIIIDNFNYGTLAPVLLDHTTGARYVGDITSTPGKVKFLLPASTEALRKFTLVSQEASAYTQVTGMATRNFINYASSANQGDYLIISHSSLFNNGSGVNYVDQYRAYRSSLTGGGFNAKIYNIDEIVDQFGYGIKKHPIAVKDFIQYVKTSFTQRPKFVFIIGKGLTYYDYRLNESRQFADRMNMIPTFGYPASDNLLSSNYGSFVPEIPIGRLSAVAPSEVAAYLDKMKQYESAQASLSQTIADKGWQKNMIHVLGGKDSSESDLFKAYMSVYENIIKDTLFGAQVETFAKSSTAAVQVAASQRIQDLFAEGLSMISYFGHSSANSLEFNLSAPETYNNQGKYPFFNVSGCTAGNLFIYDSTRFTGNMSLSEKYVLTPQRGSIGFLASTHLGIPPFLHNYNVKFYEELGRNMYGKSIGEIIKKNINDLAGNAQSVDYYTRMHVEEITLHGDPAMKINSHAKPDYTIEEPQVRINPSIVSVADNSFEVNVKMLNIGRAIRDSIRVSVRRVLPNDSVIVMYNQMMPAIKSADSLKLTGTINPVTDKGLNKIIVTLDVNNRVSELSEVNNTVTKEFFIFEDEVRPVYPYNYSIVTQPAITFHGSTANPLTATRQIVMEIDTTELFNSPFKKTYNTTSSGLIQFSPSVNFSDNTVYYWRIAMVPTTGTNYIWNSSSFIYLAGGSKGFNQSHYFQHLKSSYDQIALGANRKFNFIQVPRSLNVKIGMHPFSNYDQINMNLDFQRIDIYGCRFNSLQFYVFDSLTLDPMVNFNVTPTQGRFGSAPVCSGPTRNFFEFPYNNAASRKAAMDFLDSIPAGKYVHIANLGNSNNNTTFINQWKADTATLGSGKSLYHKLVSIGFTKIDSFNRNIPFIFFYKKGIPSFTPRQRVGATADEYFDETYLLTTTYKDGSITSPAFGPAKNWQSLHWRGTHLEPNVPDSVKIEVHGVTNTGSTVKLATVSPATDTSLSWVNANTYPYLRLRMLNKDGVYATPHQLNYWRLNAEMVPEGAVSPNIAFKMKDTVDVGENIEFALAFKNISESAFDSMKVKFIITDRNNVPRTINLPKRRALPAGDTLMITYSIDTRSLSGNNTLYVDVNPDNDQPEQSHFNNFIYKNFFVRPDQFNPLLDVTFDGVHILNRDIVSAKPHIVIKLKDESKYLALNDTSLLKVQIKYPDIDGVPGVLRTFRFDNDTLRFTPATPGGDNTATIDLKPFLPGNDAEYELIVSGKDVSGNKAGDVEYRVNFRVIDKPMISNLLNYPNPFTTSTAFVFTITGSEPPQNMRIQILTITGKVVREITKAELGPIRVGRNITEFKWDGTDQYGAKLANGVYLYRVITNLNGRSLDKFKDDGDKTDKFFNKGYGKMYLMR
jgi:hypothetical protein